MSKFVRLKYIGPDDEGLTVLDANLYNICGKKRAGIRALAHAETSWCIDDDADCYDCGCCDEEVRDEVYECGEIYTLSPSGYQVPTCYFEVMKPTIKDILSNLKQNHRIPTWQRRY